MAEPVARRSLHERPGRWELLGTCALVLLFLVFGVLTEMRSVFLDRPMTDAQVYLRAAWAVRSGGDLYAVTDDNGWHYHYPPLFAILLTPLADAPSGADRAALPSFALSIALWYLFGIVCLVFAAHHLACAIEETYADPELRAPPLGSRRWWAMRLLPLLACLPAVIHTLTRGQVNLLLLALLCGMAAALLRRRSMQAGLWLAGAICLKLFPAYLLIYPVWRGDVRCLAGCALGLLVGFALIPAAALGPERALDSYREWVDVLIRPGLGRGADQSRAKELIEITATDSQSFLAVLHNASNPDPATRPHTPTPELRRAHWAIGGVLTLVTLLVAGGRRRTSGPEELALLGQLTVVMALLSPVCHLHYFCLLLPLALALVARDGENYPLPAVSWTVGLVLAVVLVMIGLPHLPFDTFQPLRDFGLATCGSLLLWLGGLVLLCRTRSSGLRSMSERKAVVQRAA